ncbi:MAG: hypothetical protein WCK34_05535 [Bacteroidota bacterium]
MMKQRAITTNRSGAPEGKHYSFGSGYDQEFIESEENVENNFYSVSPDEHKKDSEQQEGQNNHSNLIYLINQDSTLVVRPFIIK